MKVSWPHTDEYSELPEYAEFQRLDENGKPLVEFQREDGLAPSRGIFNGVLIGAMLWVFCVWAWVKVARYF